MALLFFTGFETHHTKAAVERLFPVNSIDAGVTFPSGRVAGKSMSGSTVQSKMRTGALPVVGSTVIAGVGMRATSPEPGPKIVIYDGANEQIRLEVTNVTGTGYKLSAKRGVSTLATSSVELANGQWYFVEFKVVLATAATGLCELRINLSTVSGFSVSSIQTANAGTSAWTAVEMYVEAGVAVGAADAIDDMYFSDASGVDNNDYLGDVIEEALQPNADGDTLQWTPLGGGTHFSEVDEVGFADDDATYIQTAINGNADLFKLAPLSISTGAIKGVIVHAEMRLLAAGSRNVKIQHKHTNGTVSEGATKAVNDTAYRVYSQLWERNPATSAAWQLADFNTGGTPAQIGPKAVA